MANKDKSIHYGLDLFLPGHYSLTGWIHDICAGVGVKECCDSSVGGGGGGGGDSDTFFILKKKNVVIVVIILKGGLILIHGFEKWICDYIVTLKCGFQSHFKLCNFVLTHMWTMTKQTTKLWHLRK